MPSLRTFLSRYSLAIAFAFVTSTTLVLLMERLIRPDGNGVEEAFKARPVDIWAKIEEPDPVTRPKPPKEPPPPEMPPDDSVPTPTSETGGPVDYAIPPPTVRGPKVEPSNGTPDGDLLPIVKVRPVYPNRARTRGVEGYVIVQFTVDELGRVVDPVVIDAAPNDVFDKAALDAVRRFKYRPRVVNGDALIVTDVKHRITFELT